MRTRDITRRILMAITKIGAECTLANHPDKPSFIASIQPLRSQNLHSPITGSWGVSIRRRAVLYAPWNGTTAQINPDSRLLCQKQAFRVLQTETLSLAGRPLYLWAILEPEGESAN